MTRETPCSSRWTSIALIIVIIGVISLVDASTHTEELTLSATFQQASGSPGIIDFTFELESYPDILPGVDNHSSLPNTQSIPELSTVVLVGPGMLGLGACQKTSEEARNPQQYLIIS